MEIIDNQYATSLVGIIPNLVMNGLFFLVFDADVGFVFWYPSWYPKSNNHRRNVAFKGIQGKFRLPTSPPHTSFKRYY
jgi:hypothetical protein